VLRSKLPPAALICLGHLWVGGGEQDDGFEFHPDGSSSGGGGNGSGIIGDFDGGATVAVFGEPKIIDYGLVMLEDSLLRLRGLLPLPQLVTLVVCRFRTVMEN
jgi:hypothetical protein